VGAEQVDLVVDPEYASFGFFHQIISPSRTATDY
jgi:hypothetical protein